MRSRLPATPALLGTDADAQDIVSLNLQRAVQLCVDIVVALIASKNLAQPSTMAEAFERLHEQGWIYAEVLAALRSAVGFRNVAVHGYRKLDWAIVHRVASDHLDDFRKFVEQLVSAGMVNL